MAAPVPSFGDVAKSAGDLLTKDFYHVNTSKLEVKTKAPNGVQFSVKGNSDQKSGAVKAELEGKYTDKLNGLTFTQGWTTANSLNTKLELENKLTQGLKAEVSTTFLPASASKSAKLGLFYQHPKFHARTYLDNVLKGAQFSGDVVVGHEGFLAGAAVGYDILDGRVTKYAASLGYKTPEYTAAIEAGDNLSVFAASYYHRVNSQTEAGAKAVWDAKGTAQGTALEVATKYKIDSTSFVKAKIANSGIASFAYSQLLRPGVTLGLGVSVDTQRLNEAAHKVGLQLNLEA